MGKSQLRACTRKGAWMGKNAMHVCESFVFVWSTRNNANQSFLRRVMDFPITCWLLLSSGLSSHYKIMLVAFYV